MKKIIPLISLALCLGCQNNESIKNNNNVPPQDKITDSIAVKTFNPEQDSIQTSTLPEKNTNTPTEAKTSKPAKRTEADNWNDYYAAKSRLEEAKKSNNINLIIKALKDAAHYAHELDRYDIEAWQLNNIGHYSIVEFKARTDYTNRMNTIAQMKPGKEKANYIKDTKLTLEAESNLLTNASQYLYQARELDKDLNDNTRTMMINNNIEFINWVQKFLSK